MLNVYQLRCIILSTFIEGFFYIFLRGVYFELTLHLFLREVLRLLTL